MEVRSNKHRHEEINEKMAWQTRHMQKKSKNRPFLAHTIQLKNLADRASLLMQSLAMSISPAAWSIRDLVSYENP